MENRRRKRRFSALEQFPVLRHDGREAISSMPGHGEQHMKSSEQASEASGEIGGKVEAPRSADDIRAEMAEAEKTAKGATDMYRDYFKKSISKSEESKQEMEKLWGMKEAGHLNLTAEDLVAMENDRAEEAAALKRIAEKYRQDAVEADRKFSKLEDELHKLGKGDRPN